MEEKLFFPWPVTFRRKRKRKEGGREGGREEMKQFLFSACGAVLLILISAGCVSEDVSRKAGILFKNHGRLKKHTIRLKK
ncbi:MAG: hypothetical protein U9P10_06525 [Thermodesulfobacteriota bacterium]|nr:hypothetical protein [Thermodesulfobacteriota bacterium]